MFRLCECFASVSPINHKCYCFKLTKHVAKILNEYEKNGFAFLQRVFIEKDYLEKVTGLDDLYRESEAVIERMEGLDWDSEEDGEE